MPIFTIGVSYKIKLFTKYVIFINAVLTSSTALGGAFQLKEQSASALGNAFAGYTAHADDISIMWQNPAAMTMFHGTQSLISLTAIIPKNELKNSSTSDTFGFTGVGSISTQSDIARDAILPAIYFMLAPEEHKNYRFGVSINTPFGLTTKYDTNATSRYNALTSSIKTITVTPSIAYKVSDNWSIGGGPQIQYFDIRLTNAINCGEIAHANSGGAFGTDGGALAEDCYADNSGNDIAAGFVASIHADYDKLNLGLTYRSKVIHDLDGDIEISQSQLISGTPALATIAGQLQSQGISSKITTPETVNIGASYDITHKWTLLADAVWTNWSHLETLTIDFDSEVLAQGSNSTVLNYDDVWFISAGANYNYDDKTKVRAGMAYDWSPIPDDERSARLPDEDRLWLTAGVTHNFNDKISLDLSYAHIFTRSANIDIEENNAAGVPAFSGSYGSSVDIIGLQFNYKF